MNLGAFLLGVVSSIAATVIVFIFRSQFSSLVNIIFFKVFPKVAGKYKLLTPDRSKVDIRSKDILRIYQLGAKVWGTNETFKGDNLISKDKITGRVTPSRILLFTFETITSEHHNFGSGIFRISLDNKKMEGLLTLLCAKCQNALSLKAKLEKIVDAE